MRRREIAFTLLVVLFSAVWLLASCTSSVPSASESVVPKPDKIIVHFEDGESVTLDRSDPMFGSFFEASLSVVTSLNTLLPLLTPREIVGDIKERSTYVELVFSAPFRLTTGLGVPSEERGRYRVGVDIDEKGRRLIEPDNIVLFLTGDRRDVVLVNEPRIQNPSAWQGRSFDELKRLVEQLGNQR